MLYKIFLVLILAAVFIFFLMTTKNPEKPESFSMDKKITDTSIGNFHDLVQIEFNKEQPAFNIKSQSALAREVSSSKTFYELNTNQRWPIASLTKLMTAIIALEKIPSSPETQNLIKIMVLVSSNEAAEQLANLYGAENFVNAMNQKTEELAMRQTSFFDATGLSYLDQSTVADLYKLVNYIAQKHPQIFQWSREKELNINGAKYTNTNKFVKRADFLGGKTGYTDEASGNLISIFGVGNKPIVIIVLGASDKIERFEQTKNLLEWITQYYKL